jgi:hypothetical protein
LNWNRHAAAIQRTPPTAASACALYRSCDTQHRSSKYAFEYLIYWHCQQCQERVAAIFLLLNIVKM